MVRRIDAGGKTAAPENKNRSDHSRDKSLIKSYTGGEFLSCKIPLHSNISRRLVYIPIRVVAIAVPASGERAFGIRVAGGGRRCLGRILGLATAHFNFGPLAATA